MTSLPLVYTQVRIPEPAPKPTKVDHFLEGAFWWIVPAFFGLVTLVLFYDVLLLPKPDIVLSHYGHDITSLMFPMWSFAAKEIQGGHTPLWNPHIFSGSPFVGNFNSGLFYPLHWLIRWLPLAAAINWILAIDFFLAGYFAALWGRVRGLSTIACIIVGMVFAFSGPLFLHLYPGHIPVVSSAPWMPVVFLAIDALRKDWPRLKWALVGGLAVGMQILTGFPQVVYYTALLAGIYTLFCLFGAKQPVRMAILALLFYVIGPAMGAVQLLPGLQTAGESARAGGNAFDFAAMTALPPENLLMTFAPGVFGDFERVASKTFVGSAYPWEHFMYLGVVAVALALYGICRGRGQRRWPLVVLSILALLLGFGVYIKPFFRFLFDYMPLYGSFRGTARFNMLFALFVGLLAGIGWDALAVSKRWIFPISVLVFAGIVALFGGYLAFSAEPALWKNWLHFMSETHFLSDTPAYYQLRETIRDSAATAGESLLWAAGGFTLLAALLVARRFWPVMRYAIALFLVVELFCFAESSCPSGPTALGYPPVWKGMIDNIDPDYRVFTSSGLANQSMVAGFNDVFGYDPVLLKRYAQILALNQGVDPDQVNFAVGVGRVPEQSSLSIYRLMRCQFIFAINPNNQGISINIPGPMHQLTLVPNIDVKPGTDDKRAREEMYDALEASDFEPTRTVLLESQPTGWTGSQTIPAKGPPLDASVGGTVELVKATSDSLEIKADLDAPRILLITDGYSRYWKARPLESGPQSQYQVMPADYAFRAVPLAAGKHHFIIEYTPDGFGLAKASSIGTGLGAAGLCLWLAVAARKKVRGGNSATSTETSPNAAADVVS